MLYDVLYLFCEMNLYIEYIFLVFFWNRKYLRFIEGVSGFRLKSIFRWRENFEELVGL